MQEQCIAGVPVETRWVLSNSSGSIDLPPEQGGLPRELGLIRQTSFRLRPGLEVYTYTTDLSSSLNVNCKVLSGQPYLWLSHIFSGTGNYRQGSRFHGEILPVCSYRAMLRDPVSDLGHGPGNHRAAGLYVTPARLREMLAGERLCRPIDDFIDGTFDPLVASSRGNAILHGIAGQICNHPYHGAMASMFLEAKALEMLTEALREMIDDSRPEAGRGRRYAMAARDIIMADLSNPPRIEDIAKQLGLSHRRLNEVFREVFNGSPMQCLMQWRFDAARQILAAGELTVKQVAHQVGYAHVSNFSLAFTRRFGHPPSGPREK